ncbi:unnamed protein product, partial [marine sediment metagenome]
VARHPLSVLAPAVCSKTEAGTIADGKITTHAGASDAHHTKTAPVNTVAGDNIIVAADVEGQHNSVSFIKKKEVTLKRAGAIRVKFDMKSSDPSAAQGEVRKNDVLVGATQSQGGTTFVTKSQDISGWAIGNKCQLWMKAYHADVPVRWKNFRLCVANPAFEGEVDLDT